MARSQHNENRIIDICFDKNQSELSTDSSLDAVFGVVTDIQYADCNDRASKPDKPTRRYRNGLNLLDDAVTKWKAYENDKEVQLSFLLQLGDFVDRRSHKTSSKVAMETVLARLEPLTLEGRKTKLLHVWGNHDLDCFNRSDLLNTPLNTSRVLYGESAPSSDANYYSYQITDQVRLICLDLFEFSLIGYPEDDPIFQQALKFMRNLEEDENPLATRPHLNGGTSATQFDWLKTQLADCRAAKSKAIVCGHVPIWDMVSTPSKVAWNSKMIKDLLWTYSDVVVAYLAGHFHAGGVKRDKKGIYHITVPAIVETLPDSNSMGTFEVYQDGVRIVLGEGPFAPEKTSRSARSFLRLKCLEGSPS